MPNNKTDDREIVLGDPIIREIRAVRDEFFASCGYDVGEMFRRMRVRHRALVRQGWPEVSARSDDLAAERTLNPRR